MSLPEKNPPERVLSDVDALLHARALKPVPNDEYTVPALHSIRAAILDVMCESISTEATCQRLLGEVELALDGTPTNPEWGKPAQRIAKLRAQWLANAAGLDDSTSVCVTPVSGDNGHVTIYFPANEHDYKIRRITLHVDAAGQFVRVESISHPTTGYATRFLCFHPDGKRWRNGTDAECESIAYAGITVPAGRELVIVAETPGPNQIVTATLYFEEITT